MNSNEKMIARRVRLGYNEAESRSRLAELLDPARTGRSFMEYALVYEGFATATQAAKVAA